MVPAQWVLSCNRLGGLFEIMGSNHCSAGNAAKASTLSTSAIRVANLATFSLVHVANLAT